MTAQYHQILEQWQGNWLENIVARTCSGNYLREEYDASLRRDLAENVSESLEIEAERFAIAEDLDNEDPLLFFDAGDNQVVCLCGQWLHDPHVVLDEIDTNDEFDWFRSFSLIRAPHTGIVFELKSRNTDLIRAERVINLNLLPLLEQSLVLEGTLDTLQESLQQRIS